MAKTKITIIGGGSYNWGPTLLRDIAAERNLSGTIVLHDIDPVAMADLTRLGTMMMRAPGADFTVECSDDLQESLRGAEFVIVTITTGGLEAMRHDLDIPRKYGVFQSVGDTVGPGGLARALRNIPVLVDIARTMEAVCPDAWLLNISNPLTALTRAVTKVTRVKAIGLCHELFGVRRTLLEMFDAQPADVDLQVAGINHLIWLLDLKIKGRDGFQMLRDYVASGQPIPVKSTSGGHRAPFQDRWQVKLALFDIYGYLPAAGDRHVAEFFPYFLTAATRAENDYGVVLTEIEHRYAVLEEERERVRGWLSGASPLSLKRSQEEVSDIIAAIVGGYSIRTIINVPNRGQIDNLPREAVVETLGVVGPTGAYGISVGALPPGILSAVQSHVVNQELIVDAALAGDRGLALQALLGDPLVHDFRTAPRMLDELLAAHARYLPQFSAPHPRVTTSTATET
jgi:alpha-galactosidase/6-phospho-beta-glucosidase family protein